MIIVTGAHSQSELCVMFYNVENLFDTNDDPLKDDNDFLPDGFMRWTPWKYWEKLKNITRVITAVGEMYSPALVGLCEVENDSVIFDLTKRSALRNQGYSYIITNSPDNRGIDVALLYQQHQFNLLEYTEYEITFSNKKRRPTRNILHAVGEVINGNLIDVFICHFPSRSEGVKESDQARNEAAALLKSKVDSIFLLREDANILIMGDFNDNPDSNCLSEVLKITSANNKKFEHNQLYNMLYLNADNKEMGTYKYKGRWEVIDNFIVSGNLLVAGNKVYIKNGEAKIYNESFLLEKDKNYYGKKPYRTNFGPRYNGGFSDHLPIFMNIIISE